MAQLPRTTHRWIAVLVLASTSLGLCQNPPVGAESLGNWSAHRCAGCASGACIPRPTTYGYYRAVWRRWPETALEPDDPVIDTPDTELPSVLEENRFRERTRSDQPLDNGRRQDAELPNNLLPDDDPFRTVPETEVPDFDVMRPQEGPADRDGGVLDNFDDDEPFEFEPAEPPADEPGLPGLDGPPGDLDLLPFGSNQLRSPKRLALNLTRDDPQDSRDGPAIVPPANANSMQPWARPRALPWAPAHGSVAGSRSTDRHVVEPESKTNHVGQISDETVIYQPPDDSSSTAQNPLRSKHRLAHGGDNKMGNDSARQRRGIVATASHWAIAAEQAETEARPTRSATPMPRSGSNSVHKNPYR